MITRIKQYKLIKMKEQVYCEKCKHFGEVLADRWNSIPSCTNPKLIKIQNSASKEINVIPSYEESNKANDCKFYESAQKGFFGYKRTGILRGVRRADMLSEIWEW